MYVSKDLCDAAQVGNWYMSGKNTELSDIVEKHRATEAEHQQYGIQK